MDSSILYIILAVGIAFGVAYLVSYLRRKNLLKQEDLMFAVKALDLSSKVIDELNLQHQPEIKRISQVVIDSLEYAITFYQDDADIINNAYDYAIELCGVLDIELNEERKNIIRELISITFQNKYMDSIEK